MIRTSGHRNVRFCAVDPSFGDGGDHGRNRASSALILSETEFQLLKDPLQLNVSEILPIS